VFDYYPKRSSPILVNFGSRGVTVAALLPGCMAAAESVPPCAVGIADGGVA